MRICSISIHIALAWMDPGSLTCLRGDVLKTTMDERKGVFDERTVHYALMMVNSLSEILHAPPLQQSD